jgi:tRNA/rRNA methyltransferase
MGFTHLVVVDPENFDTSKILKMATHAAVDIANNIKVFSVLKDALSPYSYVAGTTARLGGQRQVINSPRKLAGKILSLSKENKIALLFGPEDRGLTNEDIRYCHALVNIPTSEFSSLNLSQSVMVMCYELFLACREEGSEFAPRLANRHELDGMYEQLKDILIKISYINPENPDYWMNKLRHFGTRMRLRAKEVSIIRGLCRQINWYGKKRYKDGLAERKIEE